MNIKQKLYKLKRSFFLLLKAKTFAFISIYYVVYLNTRLITSLRNYVRVNNSEHLPPPRGRSKVSELKRRGEERGQQETVREK